MSEKLHKGLDSQDFYDPRALLIFRLITALLMVGVLFGSCAVLWLWYSGAFLQSYLSARQPMIVPNSAALFLLVSISFLILWTKPHRILRMVARFLAILVIIFSLLVLFQWLLQIDMGIDRWLLVLPRGPSHPFPGRMAPFTIINFLFMGLALLYINSKRSWGPLLIQFIGFLICTASSFVILGYVYGASFAYTLMTSTIPNMGMALPTAIFSLLIGNAFLGIHCKRGFMALSVQNTAGGSVARSLFWVFLAVSLLLGYIVKMGVKWGVGHEFIEAVSLLATILIFSTLIWFVSRNVHRSDLKQKKLLVQLRRSESEQRFLADLSISLSESLDFKDRLRKIGAQSVAFMADWCLIDLVDADKNLYNVVAVHADPTKQALVTYYRERFPLSNDVEGVVLDSLSYKRPCIVSDIGEEWFKKMNYKDERVQLLKKLGLHSFMVVPFVARDHALGTICFVNESRNFTQEDLHFAQQISNSAAVLVDNVRLYQETRRLLRARDEVLAVVSHDLKTPISVSSLSAVLIQELAKGCEDLANKNLNEIKRLALVIKRSSVHAFRLIADLLDFAKMEEGIFKVQYNKFYTNDLFDELKVLMQPLVLEAELTLENQSSRNFEVNADKQRILQVLCNLVGNAIKFSAPKQKILIKVESCANAELLFSVKDFGIGIAVEIKERIFDRYWMSPNNNRSQGSGLGLAIAKGIITAHGGKIWVESEPHKGSSFFFSIKQFPIVSL